MLRADLIGVKQSIVDELLLLNPYQIPLLSLAGIGKEVGNTKHEWIEDSLFAAQDSLTAGMSNTDTSITVADASKFMVDHVIQPQSSDELILVTAVNTSTNVLTVTRGYAGTTAAAATSGTIISMEYVRGIEARDARDARYKAREAKYNFTQIFDRTIEVSGTAEAVDSMNISSLYEYEKQKELLALALDFERACVSGVRYSSGTDRKLGGLRSFIATNVVSAGGAAINEAMINEIASAVSAAGGFKTGGNYVLMTSPKQRRKLASVYASSLIVPHTDTKRGVVIDSFVTDYGEFDIRVNPNFKPDEIMLIDISRIKPRPLKNRNWFHTYLGRKGDYTQGQLIGEFTLEFKQEAAHARISGLEV